MRFSFLQSTLILAITASAAFGASNGESPSPREALQGEWSGKETLMLTGKCQFRPVAQKIRDVRWALETDTEGNVTIRWKNPAGPPAIEGRLEEDGTISLAAQGSCGGDNPVEAIPAEGLLRGDGSRLKIYGKIPCPMDGCSLEIRYKLTRSTD